MHELRRSDGPERTVPGSEYQILPAAQSPHQSSGRAEGPQCVSIFSMVAAFLVSSESLYLSD